MWLARALGSPGKMNKWGGLTQKIFFTHITKKDIFIALIKHWETQTFPNFYSRNGKERSASDTLRDFANEILKVSLRGLCPT